jgi:cation diffusion facilitator family transporter
VSAAIIHIIGDIVQSVGVVIAAIIIYINQNYHIADPICTFIFSVIVFFTTINITKKCINILMEACPENINSEEVKITLMENVLNLIRVVQRYHQGQ